MQYTCLCPKCSTTLEAEDEILGAEVCCPNCNETFMCTELHEKKETPKKLNIAQQDYTPETIFKTASEKFARIAGIEKIEGFSFSKLFKEVFAKHSSTEVENGFVVGTEKTTPQLDEVEVNWPTPWIFVRMMIASIVVYFLFLYAFKEFENLKLIPAIIMMGAFAIPISTLMFFFEINITRNISISHIAKLLFGGGVASLIISLFLFELKIINSESLTWLGASIAGPVEETGKLLAVLLIPGVNKYKYKINGLLLGATVGAGFAIFETMGYAFEVMLMSGAAGENWLGMMTDVIFMRGVLSPLCHIIWTAITCCALWRVKGDNVFDFRMLADIRFLRLFAIPVVLHMIWNSPFDIPFYGKYIILGFIGWFIVISLLQEGLNEISRLKTNFENENKDISND